MTKHLKLTKNDIHIRFVVIVFIAINIYFSRLVFRYFVVYDIGLLCVISLYLAAHQYGVHDIVVAVPPKSAPVAEVTRLLLRNISLVYVIGLNPQVANLLVDVTVPLLRHMTYFADVVSRCFLLSYCLCSFV